MLTHFRFIVGILAWSAAIAGMGWSANTYFSRDNPAAAQLTTFLAKPRSRIEIRLEEEAVLQIGDPIIIYDDEVAHPVGRIIDIHGGPTTKLIPVRAIRATAEFFSSAPTLTPGDFLAYHQTPDSVEWMVQMMLPPKIREKIGSLILRAYREHQSELSELLQPIFLQTARDATQIIRDEFVRAIEKRDPEIKRLGERYQAELVERKLIPLIQDEIWPIVQEEATPIAREIGIELWEKVSVWRFGWRILYDRSPLPERNLAEKEFQRFVNKYGAPILEARVPDILKLQQSILSRVSDNEKVQQVVGDMAGQILRDSEFQQLASDVLREVFVDNERLMAAFEKNWKSEEAVAAMAITNQRLESTVTKIGQTLFGDPERSITPEFSRILRHRILHKDKRWLVLHLEESRSENLDRPRLLKVVRGVTGTENPFHIRKSELP